MSYWSHLSVHPHLKCDSILNLLELGFCDNILWVTAMKIGDNTHSFLIAVDVNEPPARQTSVMTSNTTNTRREKVIPRALRHHERAGSQDGADNTLDEQGNAPGQVRLDKRAEVINPLDRR